MRLKNNEEVANIRTIGRLVLIIGVFLFILVMAVGWTVHKHSEELILNFRIGVWEIDRSISRGHGFLKTVLSFGKKNDKSDYAPFDQLPKLEIRQKAKNYWKLESERQAILANQNKAKIVPPQSFTWTKGKLLFDNKTIDISVRLKGDGIEHILGLFPSLRLKVRSGGAYDGMVRFDLQKPRNRDALNELIVREFIQRYDILVPRALLVRYFHNNEYKGIAFVEELLTAKVMDRFKRRAGISLQFDDNLFVAAMVQDSQLLTAFPGEPQFSKFASQKIQIVYKKDKEELPEQWLKATSLLRSFQQGNLKASSVFKVKQLAYLLASAEIFGSKHGISLFNFRLYYDPVVNKFEPWWWDSKSGNEFQQRRLLIMSSQFARKVLADPIIYQEFRRAVSVITEDLSKPENINLIRNTGVVYQKILNREDKFQLFPIDQIVDRAIALDNRLGKKNVKTADKVVFNWQEHKYPEIVRAVVTVKDGKPVVELANIVPEHVRIKKLELTALQADNSSKIRLSVSPPDFVLRPFLVDEALEWHQIGVPLLNGVQIKDMVVEGLGVVERSSHNWQYEFTGGFQGPLIEDLNSSNAMSMTQVKQIFPSARIDKNEITIPAGVYQILRSIDFPKNLDMRLEPGVTLFLGEGVSLIFYGKVHAHGTIKEPIRFMPIDPASKWGAIVFFSMGKEVSLRSVLVTGTSGASDINPEWDAGIVVISGSVSIENSVINHSIAEDAINIIGGTFSLDGLTVSDAASDGIDVDYSMGSITRSSFDSIGGDAIDIANSEVTVSDVYITHTYDKGMSIGESSKVNASNIKVMSSSTGIAVKDSSKLNADGIEFVDIAHNALFAYQKKSIFGGGDITVTNVSYLRVGNNAVSELGSSITVDGELITGQQMDIEKLYESGYMKK